MQNLRQPWSALPVFWASPPATGPYTQRNTFPNLQSQSTHIFGYVDGNGESAFIYVGDHWQSAPDRVKGHDFTVFAPLQFDATGNVTCPGFVNEFNVTITLP